MRHCRAALMVASSDLEFNFTPNDYFITTVIVIIMKLVVLTIILVFTNYKIGLT